KHHGIGEDNIVPTNGGDELLRLIITTFANHGDVLAVAEPSYSLYPVLAQIHHCELVRIPLNDNWGLAKDFAQQLNAAKAKLAFIVNPHAPTGLLSDAESLLSIAKEFKGVLVIDEAYIDFIDPQLNHDLIPQVVKLDNVIILRTLSKGYSLAGLRFGYGIGPQSLISPMLYKTRDSYNTDYISQQLACAAIESVDYASQTWHKVRQMRQQLSQQLQQLGLSSLASESNFLLVQIPAQFEAKALYLALKAQNILVRYFDEPRLDDKLRITVGTQQENQQLLDGLSMLLKQG
ncbi:MAG: histidinol-phosphatase, partial [SAR86 cluster bacterium]